LLKLLSHTPQFPTMHALLFGMRPSRSALGTAALIAATAFGSLTAQTPTPSASAGVSVLQGFVMDSIHNAPLADARVLIEGTNRSGRTTAEGRYRIDSIPPGPHRVVVTHPLLDTVGLSMRTPEYPFAGGKAHDLDLAIPPGEKIAMAICTAAQRNLGPAAMVGFVKDADVSAPVVGAKVELVFTQTDIIGRKRPIVRSSPTDSLGFYRICGLPADMTGKVQVFRNGVSSGEVAAEVTNGSLALRAFSIGSQKQIAEVAGDSGKVKRIARGSSRVTGVVTDKLGKPLVGARVMLQGGGATAISRSNGEFTLDSLPSGTQALEVRKLGYAAADVPVELSSNQPAKTTVVLGDFIPTLEVMRVEAAQDKALSKVGYLERKNTGLGYFMDGDRINHAALSFSDVMRVAPGLKVTPLGDGRSYVIQDSRSASNGCVNFYVDGSFWTTMQPGDIDQYVRPDELVAIEVYHGSQAPPQYTQPGQSGCAAIVVWTVAKVRPDNTSKKKP
jgi:hypothetical protein